MAHTQLRLGGVVTAWRAAPGMGASAKWRFEERVHGKHARAIANELADPDLLVQALHLLAVHFNAHCDLDPAVKCARKVLEVPDWASTLRGEPRSYVASNLSTIFAKAGYPDQAEKLADVAIRLMTEDVADRLLPEHFLRRARVALLRGDLNLAARHLGAARSKSGEPGPIGLIISARVEATFEFLSGHADCATDGLEKAREKALLRELGDQVAKIDQTLTFLQQQRTNVESLVRNLRDFPSSKRLPRQLLRVF